MAPTAAKEKQTFSTTPRAKGALPGLLPVLKIATYLFVWNFSLVSLCYPLVLYYAFSEGHTGIFYSILIILAICYFPYPEGSFPLCGKTIRGYVAGSC
jgi:hypothetical protein